MITDSYQILPSVDYRAFKFYSIGVKGKIEKVVVFQSLGGNRFNLAFGDMETNGLNDRIISNNLDFVKVMATVAKCVYVFLAYFPDAIIEIKGVDQKRQNFYNTIFKRKWEEIAPYFDVKGIVSGILQPYNKELYFDKFVIQQKRQ